MKILSDESNSMAISWLPHGFSFRIHDRPAFLELLTDYERRFMPGKGSHYSSSPSSDATSKLNKAAPARTIKWTSLTRKMCRWNILRMAAGPDAGAYFHPKMQRDCPELVDDMVIGSEGATAGDVLKTRSQQPPAVVAAAAQVTQFAQAKAKANMAAAAARQAQAQTQQSPSLFRINPSAPLSPASHLAALSSLQELVQRSKLAAIRAGPQLGFDAKVIEAELLSQQQQAKRSGDSTAASTPGPAPTAPATAAQPQPQIQPKRQSITQSILAAAAAASASSATSTPAPTSTPSATTSNAALALSIQQARMENERLRLLSNQIRLGQQRQQQQQQVEAVAAAMATAKADATVPKTNMSGKVVLHSFSNAQA